MKVARILRFPASKPPRMNGPQILDRLKSEDDELREAAEREDRRVEGEQVGVIVAVAILVWFWWVGF